MLVSAWKHRGYLAMKFLVNLAASICLWTEYHTCANVSTFHRQLSKDMLRGSLNLLEGELTKFHMIKIGRESPPGNLLCVIIRNAALDALVWV